MELREARPMDRPAIRDVARRSLQASYSLEPSAIIGAIEEWYDENQLRKLLANEDALLLIVKEEGQTVAFAESVVIDDSTAEIRWLHVDPDHRGEGYGEAVYEMTRDQLEERGVGTLHGRVLADNEQGNYFYEHQGLTKVGEETAEIDGTHYVENVYAEVDVERMEELSVNGDTVYVDHETTETASLAPFHVVYTTEDAEDIYGYWCSNCETLATAMGPSGRVQCDECENTRKPTRWDAAYL
jgi:ribosomal protein S18 acetylase RimI-like enzyme